MSSEDTLNKIVHYMCDKAITPNLGRAFSYIPTSHKLQEAFHIMSNLCLNFCLEGSNVAIHKLRRPRRDVNIWTALTSPTMSYLLIKTNNVSRAWTWVLFLNISSFFTSPSTLVNKRNPCLHLSPILSPSTAFTSIRFNPSWCQAVLDVHHQERSSSSKKVEFISILHSFLRCFYKLSNSTELLAVSTNILELLLFRRLSSR